MGDDLIRKIMYRKQKPLVGLSSQTAKKKKKEKNNKIY